MKKAKGKKKGYESANMIEEGPRRIKYEKLERGGKGKETNQKRSVEKRGTVKEMDRIERERGSSGSGGR